jgi:uncharacterized protein (DUF433 family)
VYSESAHSCEGRPRVARDGATPAEILADYPYLQSDDITAVLQFAARQNDHPIFGRE